MPSETSQRPDSSPAVGVLLLLMSTLAVMGSVLLAPVLPLMAAWFADTPGSAVLVPVALVTPALCIALASPFAGMLIDAAGRKRVLLVAFVGYAAFGTAPWWLGSLPAIIATRVGVGVAEAAIMTASTTLIADCFAPARREKWLAWQTAVASLSAIALIAAGGALGEHGGAEGWRTPFLAYAGALLFLVPSLLMLPARGPYAADRARVDPRAAIAPIAGLCGVSVVAGAFFYVVPIQLGFVLTARGVSAPAMIGAASALGSAAVPAGSLLFSRIARQPLARLLGLAFGLTAGGFVVIGEATGFGPTLFGVALAGLGGGVALPALLTAATALLPVAIRGQGVGFWMASFFLGQFLSPIAVAAMTAAAGGIEAAITALGVLAGLAAAAAFTLARRTPGVSVADLSR
jgi:MFS family permease